MGQYIATFWFPNRRFRNYWERNPRAATSIFTFEQYSPLGKSVAQRCSARPAAHRKPWAIDNDPTSSVKNLVALGTRACRVDTRVDASPNTVHLMTLA